MLRSKSFVKRTRKGNIVRTVKEHYLRDDISCGYEQCGHPVCVKARQDAAEHGRHSVDGVQTAAPLSCTPRDSEKWGRHYLIPDTNAFINQIDIFERPIINNVVVLSTVLDELRGLSMAVYNRVRAIVREHERRWFVFSNEHHRETFIDRSAGETPNDRNDRAIRVAVKWYANHLSNTGIAALMVTNDEGNLKKAKEDGVESCRMDEYLAIFTEHPELLDMMGSVSITDRESGDSRWGGYPEYLSPVQVQAGIKAGMLVQGTLQIAAYNYLEGSIYTTFPDGKERSVLILGRMDMNRAIQGDKVAVQILPKSQWRKAPSAALVDEDEDSVPDVDEKKKSDEKAARDPAVVPGDADKSVEGRARKRARVAAEKSTPAAAGDTAADSEDGLCVKPAEITDETLEAEDGEITGRVVGIVRRNWRSYCAFLDPNFAPKGPRASNAPTSVSVLAMDRRIPKIRIRTRQVDVLAGQRILVAIDAWPKESRYPQGHFVRALGDAGDKATETEVLLLEHDVPYQPFTKSVRADLPSEGANWVFDPDRDLVTAGRRTDLRHLNVCSIDPPGCTDIDDALHAVPLPNGNFQVGVHIADVTNFVKPNTAMDKEAAHRSTTVYLVDRRIDMLPELLGTNLCSLMSNVDRLAFSCIWELDPDANIVNVTFHKSVIHSKASLTYEEAQNRMDDPSMQDDITKNIRNLNMLAKKLRKRRTDAGALTLSSPEVRFRLENDSQDPVDVEMKALKETNALVEEFMLLANISVAQKIYESFPDSALLRRHPQPPPQNFDNLQHALKPLGIELETGSSLALAQSLDRAVLPSDPYFNNLLRILTTRCMMQAQYFCSGTCTPEEFRHYGLATGIYTHFTSPIRRYADVMVHRLLHAAIDRQVVFGPELTDKVKMSEQSDVLNHRHRMAQQASRSSVELYTNLFFKGKTVEEPGYVTQILQNGFGVLIPSYGIEGVVYTSDKDKKDVPAVLQYDQESHTLVSADKSSSVGLFQRVRVVLQVDDKPVSANVSSMRRKLGLRLTEPQIPGVSMTPEELGALKAATGKTLSKADEDQVVELVTKHPEQVTTI
ncbi:RNB-domain-containing protein [Linderina pennispora]|uniref:Ribosomal RNA-processing protein 44 n=1 Tax=Linderina pennispora TaxID=61395 RepID=A0A1Y1WFH1_9FUNG|nr:RNB-domain-containing protein [Linderina pennispora]ORX72311.1 RNB-domain-containing protein [Linderina pennispora]